MRSLAADLIVVNATVRTMDANNTIAQALAIKGETIIGIGDTSDVTALADGQTRRIDANGLTVLPGFIDGHVHLSDAALANAYGIDCLRLKPTSVREVLSSIQQQVSQLPAGSWIRADNLDPDQLDEGIFPTRRQLDEVAPNHPAVVYTAGFHMASANSRALAEAGIERETPDPPGGTLERDGAGELTGLFHERRSLMRLDPRRGDAVLPKFDVEARGRAVRAEMDYLLQHGITSIHDVVVSPEEIRAYQSLRAAGDLRMRVQLLVRGAESQISVEQIVALGLQPGFGDEWLNFGGVKLSIDGSDTRKNAAVYNAYPGEPNNYGMIRIPQQELDEKVLLCHRNGVRVAIHAIGPRAVDMALDAIEKALATHSRTDHRHRIEHAYFPGPSGQLEKMARLRVVASPQAAFLYDDGDNWLRNWGEENLVGVMPLRSMRDLGITVMGSTDYPCAPVDPFVGVKAAVTRRTRNGSVLTGNEAIGVEEALRMQTTGAAFGGFEERRKGSLERGMLADLVMVSEDPLAVPAEELDRIAIAATVVGGHVRFEREPGLVN